MDETSKVVIRPTNVFDRNFVLSTWLKGQYYGSSYFRDIPQDLYFEKYANHIHQILWDPEVKVTVACDERFPIWIVGFAVFKGDSLYWIHVKRDYRNQGIASLLLTGQSITIVRALTKTGRLIAHSKGLIFNPL